MWIKGSRMCGWRGGGVPRVGAITVVGAILLLLGITQTVAGIYFMIVLPIFEIGSNIWTGNWCALCGLVMSVMGCGDLQRSRGTWVLVMILSVLLVDVANLVIIQVGENSVFMTTEDMQIIMKNNQESTLRIAFWLTTAATSLGIVVSFFGAQYLFCVVLRGQRRMGKHNVTRSLSEEDLPRSQELEDCSPSLEDVVALPEPGGSCAWVYHPEEDKTSNNIYTVNHPDVLSEFPDASRRIPLRHASFAHTRYARVHQRPQRAQSFAVRRDSRLPEVHLRLPPVICPEAPGSLRVTSNYARPDARRLHRSNSLSGRLLLDDTSSIGVTSLSRRFHGGSLDDLDAMPVIEVGISVGEMTCSESSLISSSQESHSDKQSEDTIELQPNDPEQDVTAQVEHSASLQERMLDGKKVLTSFGPVNRTLSRSGKPKGPAPPPPVKNRPSLSSLNQANTQNEDEKEEMENTTIYTECLTNDASSSTETLQIEDIHLSENSIMENKQEMDNQAEIDRRNGVSKRNSTIERHIPLPVIEENIKNTRKRPAPQPLNALDKEISPTKDIIKSNRPPDIVKPPRSSLIQKPPRLADKNVTIERRPSIPKKPDFQTPEADNEANLRRLEEVLSNILDHGSPGPLRATKSDENIMESLSIIDTKKPKGILKKVSLKPSKYEVAHREALEDSKALLEKLPRGELQRNKIVLRVPSFRTAGCQTETYRPIRRRASCAQTNLSVATRYRDVNRGNSTSSSFNQNKGTLKSSSTNNWPPRSTLRESNQSSSVVETSSSSSGYSSPEAHATPTNSGPPSPASSSVVVSDEDHQDEGVQTSDGTNVTVIEVNKNGSRTTKSNTVPWNKPLQAHFPPPRPPKPLRLRHMSDAAAFIGARGGLLVPVHHRNHQLPLYEDVYGLAALTENVMLLTEAINPVLVHNIRPQSSIEETHEELGLTPRSTTPRVVDMIRKASGNPLIHDILSPRAQPRPALRTHSLSLPRPSLIPPKPTRRYSKGSRSPSPTHSSTSEQHHQSNMYTDQHNDPHNNHTAAYLASLELLASHYRHQALANAKQLQLQQRLLVQQQKQQQQQQQQESQKQDQDQDSEINEANDTGKEINSLKHLLKKEADTDIQQKQFEQPPMKVVKTIESEC